MKTNLIALILFCVAACSTNSSQQTQNPQAQASPSPANMTVTDLAKLRWIEGSWKGTGDIDKPFYERYKFENDTTLLSEGIEDESFTKVTEASRFVLKDGMFAKAGDGPGYYATAIDDKSISFAPRGGANNSFVWERESADVWKATLKWTDKSGTPKQRVYRMDRVKTQ